MTLILLVAHVLTVLVLPVLVVGLVNRTKAWWGGRRGPRLLQSAYDLFRLAGKQPVVSEVASPLFRAGAWVVLGASVFAAMIAPALGAYAPLRFDHDFIVFAYVIGLARMFLMLSAMDVGSSFEGMGAAREAAFATYAEPALFLLIGAGAVATGHVSFAGLIGHLHETGRFAWAAPPAVLALFILLQAEAARVPVDDPLTHLELTMIHEAMILDHSGPELAAMQYAAAIKMTLYAGLIAALLNPIDPAANPLGAIVCAWTIIAAVAIAVGCVESLVARLRMRWVPPYLWMASGAALLCMVAVGWGGAR